MSIRTHGMWVSTALILALAGEGIRGSLIETVGHGAAVGPGVVVGATAVAYLFSAFVEGEKPTPPKPPAKPRAKAAPQPRKRKGQK